MGRAMRKSQTIERRPGESEPMHRSRVADLKLAVARAEMLDRWDHKREGTPETHEHASRTWQAPLSRLLEAGHIDREQHEWACEIAAVAESIERDVAIKGASWEMRVDCSGSGRLNLAEGVMRVRREMAYSWWRERIPHPRRAVLDMLIGEPLPFSAVARRYRMGHRRTKRLLIDAINLWPDAMDHADVDREEIDRKHAEIEAAKAGIL